MVYKTENNIQEAFGGESQANRRYLFYADRAEKDGYPQVARLFRAVADAETVHARNHLNAIDGIGSTKDNLFAASLGEEQEYTKMYPGFIQTAAREENERARRTFEWANRVEEIHHGYFEEALMAVREGRPLEDKQYFVCQVCGNTVIGEPPEKCAVCGAPADVFREVA